MTRANLTTIAALAVVILGGLAIVLTHSTNQAADAEAIEPPAVRFLPSPTLYGPDWSALVNDTEVQEAAEANETANISSLTSDAGNITDIAFNLYSKNDTAWLAENTSGVTVTLMASPTAAVHSFEETRAEMAANHSLYSGPWGDRAAQWHNATEHKIQFQARNAHVFLWLERPQGQAWAVDLARIADHIDRQLG